MNGGVKVFGLLTLSIHLVFTVTRYYSSLRQSKDKYKKRFEEEEEQLWSSLDPNLLGEILSRLCLTDQARFLVVCKNWLAAAHPIINSSSTSSSKSAAAALPWHGCIVPGSSQVQIYDPLSSPNHHLVSVENILWSKLGIPSPSHPLFASAAVKHNWLFLGIRKSNFFFWRRRYVLMYSPFTRRFITLPKFDYPRGFSFRSAFSTQPDSPDCVFCLVDGMNADKKIAVITYTNGDKEWTAREFNTHPHFIPDTCYPLILCGILYIVSTFGQVASYNILCVQWRVDDIMVQR